MSRSFNIRQSANLGNITGRSFEDIRGSANLGNITGGSFEDIRGSANLTSKINSTKVVEKSMQEPEIFSETENFSIKRIDVSKNTNTEIVKIIENIRWISENCQNLSEYISCYNKPRLLGKQIILEEEIVEGERLDSYVTKVTEDFDPLWLWPIMLQIIVGLRYLENFGGHGDISMSNIILSPNFKIKFVDVDFVSKSLYKQETVKQNDVFRTIIVLYNLANIRNPYKGTISSSYTKDDGRTNKFLENILMNYDENFTQTQLLEKFIVEVYSDPLNFFWPAKRAPLIGINPARQKKIGEFSIVKPLGAGSFGQTFLATDSSGRQVALKSINLKKIPSEKIELLREVQILDDLSQKVNNQYISKYYSHFFTEDNLFIATEFIDGDDLDTYLKKVPLPLNPKILWPLILQMLQGLAVIHQSGFAHRDIKPENIMISKTGAIKYIDFGLACIQSCKYENCYYQCKGRYGTPNYLPPEYVINIPGDRYELEKAHDIWSLMVTIFNVVNGLNVDIFNINLPNNPKEFFVELRKIVQKDIQKSQYRYDDGRTDQFVNNNLLVNWKERKNYMELLDDYVNTVLINVLI